jgi:serine 3-dehydrogenase
MILITGASSGIGEACARLFARDGRALVLVARRLPKLKALADDLHKEFGVPVHPFALDVTDRAAVEAFFESNHELLSNVDVLVNNAGLAKGVDLIQDANLDDWEVMMDTNVMGLLYFTRLTLPHLQAKHRGHIVNLGSVAARWVYPRGNIYCATKAAVHAISQALRLDLSGSKIRVSEISPGMVETDFSRVRLGDESKAKAVYTGMTPLNAGDIAEAVKWCVDRPEHVNIQEVVMYSVDQASTTLVNRKTT